MATATTLQQLDQRLERLKSKRADWVRVPISRRLVYLEECLQATWRVSERWIQAACQAKGLSSSSFLAGEEWAMGPMITLRNIRLLIRALRAGGRPPAGEQRRGPLGQAIIQVFPTDMLEAMLWMGITGEIWLAPGKSSSQGGIYKKGADPGPGCLSLVLGAGNVSSIAPTDVLSKLFVENQVVLLKMNPVNDYLGPLLEEAFYTLIRDGYLSIIYGGAEVGQAACGHPDVETIHITGSHHTYDAIVWGKNDKASGTPALTKPVTAELGAITPVLVVPGPWSEGDMAYQARHVAGMISTNAGFNCNAAQVLVTSRSWRHREAFLGHVREALRGLPARKAYYPGAEERYRGFLQRYPQAEVLAEPMAGCLPWTLIPGIQPTVGEYATHNEAFCGLLTEVTLEAEGTASFLAQAVDFVNEKLWGNLSCSVLIHPDSERQEPRALQAAIEHLRYGGIGINLWPGLIFALMSPTWGAFPGNTPQDIQSGIGAVHNTYLFDNPQKSVIRGAFRTPYRPPWLPGHPRLRQIGRLLAEYELAPTFKKAMAVQVEVLRGGLMLRPEPKRLKAGR